MNDGFCLAYAVFSGDCERVFLGVAGQLAARHQTMRRFRKVTADVEDVGQVVGRGEAPPAFPIHQKRKVLVVVVGVVRENVEHHAAEYLLLC